MYICVHLSTLQVGKEIWLGEILNCHRWKLVRRERYYLEFGKCIFAKSTESLFRACIKLFRKQWTRFLGILEFLCISQTLVVVVALTLVLKIEGGTSFQYGGRALPHWVYFLCNHLFKQEEIIWLMRCLSTRYPHDVICYFS